MYQVYSCCTVDLQNFLTLHDSEDIPSDSNHLLFPYSVPSWKSKPIIPAWSGQCFLGRSNWYGRAELSGWWEQPKERRFFQSFRKNINEPGGLVSAPWGWEVLFYFQVRGGSVFPVSRKPPDKGLHAYDSSRANWCSGAGRLKPSAVKHLPWADILTFPKL